MFCLLLTLYDFLYFSRILAMDFGHGNRQNVLSRCWFVFFFVRGIVPCFVKLSKTFFNLYARMWLIFGFLTVWFRIFFIIFFIWNILYVLLIHLFFKKFLHRFQKRFCRVVFCYFFYIYIFLYSLGVKMDKRICFLISKYIPKNWFSTKRIIAFFLQRISNFLSWYFFRYYQKFCQSKKDEIGGISLHLLPKSKQKDLNFKNSILTLCRYFI